MKHIKLIKKAKSGDADAFEELLMLYSDQLYRTAFLYVGNREDALDIVQETSYKAFIAIKTLKKNKYFSTWLTKILINSAYDFLKKKKRDMPYENMEQFISTKEIYNVEQIDLFRAIENLKETHRDAIILFYFHDLQIKEIANIMNIPENTVKTYLHRGKEQLKTNLKGGEYDEREVLTGNF
ncbi:sigma-70 family RNA polymerase sigma factor [Robertmurraya kyonggiensis]|uniref:Sigma-70 family RNA polymerase sigma factor n=1 Tax=Robertmurraya kyonggiensis TaxID=1037680 RepID=A0A4U1D0T4_9BACI|nr:sigma-70 family RNA polymerase sigma factor [Robertmurraya kyonggiensis]TKC15283.1 sigma-70 family RNA polymerase sigma factor [Robertmurraya kyonggiensis]